MNEGVWEVRTQCTSATKNLRHAPRTQYPNRLWPRTPHPASSGSHLCSHVHILKQKHNHSPWSGPQPARTARGQVPSQEGEQVRRARRRRQSHLHDIRPEVGEGREH